MHNLVNPYVRVFQNIRDILYANNIVYSRIQIIEESPGQKWNSHSARWVYWRGNSGQYCFLYRL